MSVYKAGIIGCGRPRREENATGFGQGHIHAEGYKASPDCELVAAADISQENLDRFCEEHSVPGRYLDHREMLSEAKLDIVSVCVWPHLHLQLCADAARAGVKAIHCEKPIAPTWGESKALVAVCDEHNVQLTFNHQRRFGFPFRKARELLDAGVIGQLVRLEAFCPNLYDWGTHWFDMMFMYNDETPVEWVIGQIDAREARPVFGVAVESQGLSLFQWRNGVQGLMLTGAKSSEGARGDYCGNRLIGTEGMIEVGVRDGPQLRLRNLESGGQWREVDVAGGIHGGDYVKAGIQDLADALKTGREPELSGRRALQATELIFATYESSRRRGRVDLPLEIEDSPLLSMLERGEVGTSR